MSLRQSKTLKPFPLMLPNNQTKLIMSATSTLVIFVCFLSIAVNRGVAEESHDYILKECNYNLKQIDSIEKFKLFMSNYRLWKSGAEKPKRGVLNLEKNLRKCYELEEALNELESIIEARETGVCRMQYIERLVNFHERFLTSKKEIGEPKQDGESSDEISRGSESSYIARFFSLYAHQVAFTCKSKLIPRMEEAQCQQDCSLVLSKYLPPVSESDEDADDVSKFMNQFKKVEEFMPISRMDSLNKAEFYYDILISPEIVDKIQELRTLCRARESYYLALFSPISILAHLGYSVSDQSTIGDDIPETRESKILQCWLATAQLCQGILRTHPIVNDGGQQVDKPVKIKFGTMPEDIEADQGDSERLIFLDTIDEIHPEIHKIVKKKFTSMGKIKRKGQKILKKLVERHINIESLQQTAIDKFMTSLVADENDIDSRVAFGGKEHSGGRYNPATIITDDVDTFFQFSTFFISSKISMIFSCVVAVALSAVFVWFTLYAMVTALKQKTSNNSHANFKTEWRTLRDKRMREIHKKFDKRNPKDHLKVYRPE